MNQEPTLTQEQRKRLDRQRFIGVQTQKRLLAFRVFITPANGINTELAKNLILAGVNVSIYDDAIVTEEDFETNFLVAKDDIGKKRGQTVFEKLKAMNPTGKNEWIDENPSSNPHKFNEDFFKNFTIMVTSQKSFASVQKWDEISKKANIPYYNQLGCGLYAFAYISLGVKYEYKEVNKKDKQVSKIWEISSLTLEQTLKKENLTRAKESVFLSAVIMMQKAESEGLTYDPFLETNDLESKRKNDENLTKIALIGASQKENYEKNVEFYRKFITTYGIDYCPVYSVVGSVISQEIIKIAENQHEPGVNWLFYESEEGYASVFKVKSQQDFIKSRVPEEVKMAESN